MPADWTNRGKCNCGIFNFTFVGALDLIDFWTHMIYLKTREYEFYKNLCLTSSVKLVQSVRCQSGSQEVPGSMSARGTFLLKLLCSSLCKQYKNANFNNNNNNL